MGGFLKPQPQQPAPADDESGGMPADPQEQAQLDQLVPAMLSLLHSKQTRDLVVDELRRGRDDLVKAIAGLAHRVFTTLEGQILGKQGVISDAVKTELADMLIDELVQIAEAAKLAPADPEALSQIAEDALIEAIGLYGESEQAAGRVDGEQSVEAMRQQLSANGLQETPVAQAIGQALAGGGQ